MALAQLIYVSHLQEDIAANTLQALVDRSQEDNRQRHITGVLLCHGRNLMQVLEGELADITALFERIRADRRHSEIRCVICKNIHKRLFPEWGMNLADLDSTATLDRNRLLRMVEDIRSTHDTSHYAIEARVVMQDFKQHLSCAA